MERKPSTRLTPGAQMISPAQLAWLQQGLLDSPCHFKVILTSIPITNMPPPSWGGQADRWQGYEAQREQVLAFLDEHALENVWFLSGDIHVGTIMRVEKAGPRRKYLEICVGPAGNINPLTLVPTSRRRRTPCEWSSSTPPRATGSLATRRCASAKAPEAPEQVFSDSLVKLTASAVSD